MSKCDLTIVLAEPERVYQPGDTIRGEVMVEVNKECRCDSLTLRSHWKTHGRGNRDAGEGESQPLFEGTWFEGDRKSFPFEVIAPTGPFTYRGKIINIDWYIEARADIPWALDPKAEVEFLLGPGEHSKQDGFHHLDAPISAGAPPGVVKIAWAIGGCFFLLFFSIFTTFVVIVGLEAGALPALLFGTVEFAVITIVAFFLLRKRLARRKLGPVEFTVKPSRLRAGETTTLDVRFEPRQILRLNGIQVRLACTEIAVSGSGTKRTTHRHTVHEQTHELIDSNESFFPGDPVELQTLLELPEDATPTFGFSDNKLGWSIDLKIDIPGWPDYTDSHAVRVVR